MAGHRPAICFWRQAACAEAHTCSLAVPALGDGEQGWGTAKRGTVKQVQMKLGPQADSAPVPSPSIAAPIISCTAYLQSKKLCLQALFDSTAFRTQILRIRDWYYAFFAQLHRNINSFAAHHEVLSCSQIRLGFSEPDQKDDYHVTRTHRSGSCASGALTTPASGNSPALATVSSPISASAVRTSPASRGKTPKRPPDPLSRFQSLRTPAFGGRFHLGHRAFVRGP